MVLGWVAMTWVRWQFVFRFSFGFDPLSLSDNLDGSPLQETADELRFAEVPSVQMAFQAHVPVRNSISFELAALNLLTEAAVSQHDARVWSLFFADDAVLLANHTPICRGRKAVDDYIEDHVKGLPVFEKLDIRNDLINDLGTYVVEYATHVANWRNGDSSGVNTGKNLRIWRREPSGALKLFRQIGMYD
jgi:hypothetical protein